MSLSLKWGQQADTNSLDEAGHRFSRAVDAEDEDLELVLSEQELPEPDKERELRGSRPTGLDCEKMGRAGQLTGPSCAHNAQLAAAEGRE